MGRHLELNCLVLLGHNHQLDVIFAIGEVELFNGIFG